MVRKINMFKGLTIPVKCKEGKIDLVNINSVYGDEIKPSVADPLKPNDPVVLTDDLQVEKYTGDNGKVIGFIHDYPIWEIEPKESYTQAQAVSNDMLRVCGVETSFVDIRTVPAKAEEGIVAGDEVIIGVDGFEKAGDGVAADAIALTGQTTDNFITIAK